MATGEKVNPFSEYEEHSDGEGSAISIVRTTEIYCGRSTAGYRVLRAGLDVIFTPNLDKVHMLIDEYYDGQRPWAMGKGPDQANSKERPFN